MFWKVTKSLLPKTKERLPMELNDGVIYQFTCGCSSTYIGRTGKQLQCRINEHCPKWSFTGDRKRPRSKLPPPSNITRHIMNCDKFLSSPKSYFKIVHSSNHHTIRKILEALEIKIWKPELCKQKENLFELKIPWQWHYIHYSECSFFFTPLYFYSHVFYELCVCYWCIRLYMNIYLMHQQLEALTLYI